MLEEFKININYIELENKNLKDSENVLKKLFHQKKMKLRNIRVKHL